MIEQRPTMRTAVPLTVLLCALGLLAVGEVRTTTSSDKIAAANDAVTDEPSSARAYTTETLRGRVVWLEDALEREFGVTTEPEAAETTVVLETDDKRLVPIVPDVRGRAFTVDSRLRDVELQLLVRRYARAPHVQVIRMFRPKDDGLYELDYWCDICAIPMFILKPCECCQGETRLRERLVTDGSAEG